MAAKDQTLGTEIVTRLTEDLLVEILVRLPVISLLRFRCVCKSWFHLIKSPSFINSHLKHSMSKNDRILIIHSLEDWTHFLSYHLYQSLDLITSLEMEIPELDYYSLKVCGPCNGLICISDWESNIVLYNPSLGEYKLLPPRPFPCRRGWKYHVVGIGFGFVSETNDYKVVSFVRFYPKIEDDEDEEDDEDDEDDEEDEDEEDNEEDESNEDNEEDENIEDNEEDENIEDNEDDEDNVGDVDDEDDEDDEDNEDDEEDPVNKVEIYNLSTKSWRQIDCEYPDSIDSDYGTLFNGALHWIAYRDGIAVILSFDMSTEVFRDMELPSDLLVERGISKSLTVLNDSLALFAYTNSNYNSEEQFVDVWVMHEYGEAKSWTKQVSIGPLTGINCPLLFWKNEAILLETTEGQLASCALDTLEMDYSEMHGVRGLMRIMVFQESLIPLV